MIPPQFEYSRPRTIEEAIAALASDEEAKALAGGHSLVPLLKLRLAAPTRLIDLGGIPGLAYIKDEGSAVAIGAMTTHYAIESSDFLKYSLPLLPEAASKIGDVQVRNRGTIGGTIAHADPAADMTSVALALDAGIVARGPNGTRTIPAPEFFVDMLTSALQPGEIVTEIRFPKPQRPVGAHYLKFNKRSIDWAIVGIACQVELDGDVLRDIRIGLTALGSTPLRATGVEGALRGQKWTPDLIRSASEKASDGLDPFGDHVASAEYKLHLSRVLTRRAIERAIANAA